MTEVFSIDHLPSRTIDHQGKTYLFFSGTAYLGMPQNDAFRNILVKSIGSYGSAFGSSRNGNLRLSIYEEAEAKLAARVEAEAALTVSSGMMAGQVVINYLRIQEATFVYCPQAHPAVWHEPGIQLPSCSMAEWVSKLPETLPTDGHVVIVVNSLDAVKSKFFSFDWVNALPTDGPITLLVDDSHGLGVIGEKGSGIWRQIPHLSNMRLIVTASLAKAMGLPGGIIFSDADTIAAIRQTAFFGACSPMPPVYLDTFVRADAIYTQAYDRLVRNVALAEAVLSPTGLFQQAPGYPVFYTKHDELHSFLLEKGIFIYSFAYPTPVDQASTRIVISAFHEPADIERLGHEVRGFAENLKLS